MEQNMNMKLLVDNITNRVLFAEVGSDVADFLFGLLQMPVAHLCRLTCFTGAEDDGGCVQNIYSSANSLHAIHLLQSKDAVLNPYLAPLAQRTKFLVTGKETTPFTKFFTCNERRVSPYVTDNEKVNCPVQVPIRTMTASMQFVKPRNYEAFTNLRAAYLVEDDLNLTPLSHISSFEVIKLLHKLGINKLGGIEERSVNLGIEKGLELVRTAFRSKHVLTDVFRRNEIVPIKAKHDK